MTTKIIKRRGFWGTSLSAASRAMIGLLVLAMLFGLTMPAGAAGAEGKRQIANVPFDFYHGGMLFPAGKYLIEDGRFATGVVSIHAVNGATRGWAWGIPDENAEISSRPPSLYFARYPDGKNYLREARNGYSSRYFAVSRSEHRSARALLGGAKQTSVILLASSR